MGLEKKETNAKEREISVHPRALPAFISFQFSALFFISDDFFVWKIWHTGYDMEEKKGRRGGGREDEKETGE